MKIQSYAFAIFVTLSILSPAIAQKALGCGDIKNCTRADFLVPKGKRTDLHAPGCNSSIGPIAVGGGYRLGNASDKAVQCIKFVGSAPGPRNTWIVSVVNTGDRCEDVWVSVYTMCTHAKDPPPKQP